MLNKTSKNKSTKQRETVRGDHAGEHKSKRTEKRREAEYFII